MANYGHLFILLEVFGINLFIFIRQKRQHSMKRKWNSNYEKETQKTHNDSDTSHEL